MDPKPGIETAAVGVSPADVLLELGQGVGLLTIGTHRREQRGHLVVLRQRRDADYVTATSAAWALKSETPEGYSKPVTIDGNPGFEAYEVEGKHSTLWVMVAKRYFLQIELQGEEAKELQEWVKRVDLKKLAEIKG